MIDLLSGETNGKTTVEGTQAEALISLHGFVINLYQNLLIFFQHLLPVLIWFLQINQI